MQTVSFRMRTWIPTPFPTEITATLRAFNIYIYIYMCVCVCVCGVFVRADLPTPPARIECKYRSILSGVKQVLIHIFPSPRMVA